MSHWSKQLVETSYRVWVVGSFDFGNGIMNDSAQPIDVYMELEINHSRPLLLDNTVVRTLPGINNFVTDQQRYLILSTQAGVVTVQPGQTLGPTAVVEMDRQAVPEGPAYDIRMRVRLVQNANATRPEDVGPVITEHIQDDLVNVHFL